MFLCYIYNISYQIVFYILQVFHMYQYFYKIHDYILNYVVYYLYLILYNRHLLQNHNLNNYENN